MQTQAKVPGNFGMFFLQQILFLGFFPRQDIQEVLAEWAAVESHDEELRGAPQILSDGLDAEEEMGIEDLLVATGADDEETQSAAEEMDVDAGEEMDVEDPPAALGAVGEEPKPAGEEMDVEELEAEEKEEAEGEKRPKKRTKAEVCPGRSEAQPCKFSQTKGRLGCAANSHIGKKRCQFCDAEALAEVAKDPKRKGNITRALRVWNEAGRQDIFEAALDLLPGDLKQGFLQALKRPSRAAPAVKARAKAKAEADKKERKTALEHRRWLGGPFTNEEERAYRQRAADDDRRMRKKFRPFVEAQAAEDDSWLSKRAKCFEAWCLKDSWGVCKKCHRMVKRSLHENNITGKKPRPFLVEHCNHCREGTGYPTVANRDIPVELQNLSDVVLQALQPLHPDVGFTSCAKHGYRVHTDMIRFRWDPYPVTENIAWLDNGEDREAAKAAYSYLMASEESSYRHFVDCHHRFLRRSAAEIAKDPRKLQLPRRVLEEEGIECAVWPHLYPRTRMCETYIRKHDVRRLDRATAKAPATAPAAPAAPAASEPQAPSASTKKRSSSTSPSTSSSSSSTGTSSDSTSQAHKLYFYRFLGFKILFKTVVKRCEYKVAYIYIYFFESFLKLTRTKAVQTRQLLWISPVKGALLFQSFSLMFVGPNLKLHGPFQHFEKNNHFFNEQRFKKKNCLSGI